VTKPPVAFVATLSLDNCPDGMSACRLFDHNSQLADEVGDLLEFGIVMMIDRMCQPLDTFVVADGRSAAVI